MRSKRNSSNGDILAGAVIGAAIIGLSSLFLTSKTGVAVRRDISRKIDRYWYNIQQYWSELNENLEGVSDRAGEWSERVWDTVEQVKGEINDLSESESRELYIGLIAGAIIGGVVTVGSTRWLSGNSSERSLSDVLEKVGSGAVSLQHVAREISEAWNKGNNSGERQERRTRAWKSDSVDDAIDFALSGLQLWRKLGHKAGAR